MWENTTPSTELPRDFCAGIGPLQLGVVLVLFFLSLAGFETLAANTGSLSLTLSNSGACDRGRVSTRLEMAYGTS